MKVNKINKLINEWIPEILWTGNKLEDFVEIEHDGSGESGQYKFSFKAYIYTESHRYKINAVETNDRTYLGACANTRKPRPGEDHTRGNNLQDGELTYETWCAIKNQIIAYELQRLTPKTKPQEAIMDLAA